MSADETDEELFAALLRTLDGDQDDELGSAERREEEGSSQAALGAWSGVCSPTVIDQGGESTALYDDFSLSLGEDDALASPSYRPTGSASVEPDADAMEVPARLDTALQSAGGGVRTESDTPPAPLALGGAHGRGGSTRRRKDPNRARNERAREIRGLKDEVTELTAQLKALKTLAEREIAGRPGGAASDVVRVPLAAELMGTPLVWETICRNQISRRARSERENARLKRVLEEQLRLANSLERMLKKPSRAMRTTGDIDLCASKRVYSLPSDSDVDAKIFDLLLGEADAAYYDIDRILVLNGIAGTQTEPIRGAQMRDGDHGRFVDMFSCNVLPFTLEATADVVWRFHSGTGKHRGPLYYKTAKTLETSQDTVIEKFAVELFSSTTRADFRFWQVIRRYVEDDRVLVVWMALVEPVEVANNAFSSCAFRERGYTVCKRESLGAGQSPFTRFQQCLRFEPYTTHAADKVLSEHEKREIGAIIEFMLNQDSVRVYLETLEDELVQMSLRTPNMTETRV